MPELPEQPTSKTSASRQASRSPHEYRILRKGSRYNITGPEGRIFARFKSASIAGPRWEELTHTPWPYSSSAYEPGLRLWELGLIARHLVGKTAAIRRAQSTPAPRPSCPTRRPVSITVPTVLALPAPRIDLARQAELVTALRKDPRLLFNANVRQALTHEVEYHRPYALWAKKLLKLLDRYEARQRSAPVTPETVTARHIAWQEQRIRLRQVVVNQADQHFV